MIAGGALLSPGRSDGDRRNNPTAGAHPRVTGLQTVLVAASAQVVLPLVHHDGQVADVALRVRVEGDLLVVDVDVSLAVVVGLDVPEIPHVSHEISWCPVIGLWRRRKV